MKIKILAVAALLALVGMLAAPIAAHAAGNMRSGNVVTVAKGEVIDATIYLAGSTITIAGDIHGDVYCAGQNIDITGRVEGDVFCAGQTLHVSGDVAGSVHLAGQTVTLAGDVGRNVAIFGQTVTLSSDSVVNLDATIYGSALQLEGKIGRDAVIGGQELSLLGSITRDVNAQAEHLSLGNGAKVGGNVEYVSRNQIQLSDGASIAGTTQRHDPPAGEKKQESSWVSQFWGAAYWFGAILVFGLVLLAWAPRTFKNTNQKMMTQSGWALLAGLVTLIVTPVVVVLLMITLLGIPLAVALLFGWLVSLVVSFAYSGYSLGNWVAGKAKWNFKWHGVMSLALGLFLLMLVMLIPIVGGMFGFAALVWGLGGIVLALGNYSKARNGDTRSAEKVKS